MAFEGQDRHTTAPQDQHMGRAKKTAAKSKPEKPSGSGHASSSGSRTDSPNPSPRSLAGNYAFDSLPTQWDNDEAVRARMRAEMNLVTAIDERGRNAIPSLMPLRPMKL